MALFFFYNTMTSKKNIFDFLALNCCKVREKSVKHFSRVPQKVDFVTMVLGQFFFFSPVILPVVELNS